MHGPGQEGRLQMRQVRVRQEGAVPEGQGRRGEEKLLSQVLSTRDTTERPRGAIQAPRGFFLFSAV